MKKIISIMICALILISAFGLASFSSAAAGKRVVIKVDEVSGNPGDKVYVPVEIENNPGFSNIAFTISFDKSALTYKSINAGLLENFSLFDHSKTGKIAVSYTGDNNIEGGSSLVCFEFNIKEKAKSKTTPIKIQKVYLKNADSKSIKCDIDDGSVKIEKACTGIHDYSDWRNAIPATCTKSGIKTRSCTKCGHPQNGKISSEGHKIERNFTIDVIAENSKPGMLSRHCSVCGTKTSIVTYTEKNSYALSINDMLDLFDDKSIFTLVYFLNGGRIYPEIKYDVTDVEKLILSNTPAEEDNYKPARNGDGTINVDVAIDRLLRRFFGDDNQTGIVTKIKRASIAGELPLGVLNRLICLILI